MEPSTTRRTVLRTASLGGLGVVAGCLGTTQPNPADANQADSPTSTPHPEDGDDVPSQDDWLLLANSPGGRTDAQYVDEVTVTVGSGPVRYAFQPAVVTVSKGTTITWRWLGFAGANNVVAVDGSFDSGKPVEADGKEFTYTFEETGSYRYVSEPHAECGMRGLVEVVEQTESAYPEVDEWLAEADNYDGTVVDETGTDRTTVTVGAAGNGGNFGFAPPALKVDTGTTVAWDWTGQGGSHDVVFESTDASSELLSESGEHYTRQFDESGVYLYACRPHRALGMKGAVVVE